MNCPALVNGVCYTHADVVFANVMVAGTVIALTALLGLIVFKFFSWICK